MIDFVRTLLHNLRHVYHRPVVFLENMTLERKPNAPVGRMLVNGIEYLTIEHVPAAFGDALSESSKQLVQRRDSDVFGVNEGDLLPI